MRQGWLLLGLLSPLLLGGCSVLSIDLQPRIRPLEEDTVEGKGTAKILLLDLSGVFSDEPPSLSITTAPPRVPLLARVQEELRKAEKDDRIKALIVRINSPGGTITASDTLYREIHEFKRRKKVPAIAAIMDVGASGGYYAALATDTIVAHPTAVTGSIGVVMYHRPKEYRASIYSGASVAPASAETALAHLAGMLGGAGPRFMYLWWP